MANRVLLIWEVIPEDTRLFLLEGEAAEKGLKAHNHFVNSKSSNDEAEWLNLYLINVKPLDITQPFVLDPHIPTTVAVSGFML